MSNMAYLYGISDFWSDFFEDSDVIEATLDAQTSQLSELYSYFLQRSSGICLKDIQEKYHADIKLVLLGSDNVVDSDRRQFKVGEVSCKNLQNRAILPTSTLNVDRNFEIVDGVLTLDKPIGEYRFPARSTSDGTWQYAVWMTDVTVDEKWIDKSYGSLVNFQDEHVLENYKAFLEGVYFLYTHGPNVKHIEKGVNIAMGMPYARETEVIIRIIEDKHTSNYVIFTATQSYEIPYGYSPRLVEGDTLVKGEVLDSWVEVKDYIKDGDWWSNIYIPREVLINKTPSEVGRCVPGSEGDKLMRAGLKHHLFEVLITRPAGDLEAFNIGRQMVSYAKPSWTFPVFVWKVPLEDDIVEMEEEVTYTLRNSSDEDILHAPDIRYMRRDLVSEFRRGKHWYSRNSISYELGNVLGIGRDEAGWIPEYEHVSDLVQSQFPYHFGNRGGMVKPFNRSIIARGIRGIPVVNVETSTVEVRASNSYDGEAKSIPSSSMVNLHLADKFELEDKLGMTLGDTNHLVKGELWSREGKTGTHVNDQPLDPSLSKLGYTAYNPGKTGEGTFLLTYVFNNVWAVYWVVDEPTTAPTGFVADESDSIEVVEVVADSSAINRSTISRNSAKFLRDRSRPDGKYENGRGDTYYATRSGNFEGWKIPWRIA